MASPADQLILHSTRDHDLSVMLHAAANLRRRGCIDAAERLEMAAKRLWHIRVTR